MFEHSKAFSSFSVKDLKAAKAFYGETLGLKVTLDDMGLSIKIEGGHDLFVYEKSDHQPATFTVLNFTVDDVEKAAEELKRKGISLEHYEGMTDADGIGRGRANNMGPDIAWFKDPDGNILSVIH